MTLPELNEHITKELVKRDLLRARLISLESSKANLEELRKATEEAQALLQLVAKETQEQIRFQLEDIVNMAIDSIFPGRYQFKMLFETKRGKTEVTLALFDGEYQLDPLSANGGGLCQPLAFALRIAVLLISKNRKVIILDEPFNAISAEYREVTFAMVKELATKLHIQFIINTHERGIMDIADNIIKVSKVKGVSHIG